MQVGSLIYVYGWVIQRRGMGRNTNMWAVCINCKRWGKESESEVTQSCLTLCHPMDCSLPGSSVHESFQARVLERVAISSSRESSQPRDWTRVSRIAGRRFTIWATRKAPKDEHYSPLFWCSSPKNNTS